LQYALTELFERRQDHQMTRSAYDEIGGVLGALGRRAEEIYQALDEQGQESSRQLFLRLVTLGEGVEDTRRRVLRSELEAVSTENQPPVPGPQFIIPGVIDVYGSARLLTFDREPITRGPTVEVAHEALLREWGRLRGWLDQSRNDVRMQRILAAAAAEWSTAGEDPGFLLRDARLDQFDGWATSSTVGLTQSERSFLDTSVAARVMRQSEEEERQQRELETAQMLAETEKSRAKAESKRAEEQAQAAGRLRRRALVLAGALVIAAILAIAAFFFAQQSNQNAEAAEENADLASTRESEALAQADQRATAQAQAETERQRADDERDTALEAEAQAEAEAEIRATAEAVAVLERNAAEVQADLATSRELAAASLANLVVDPELSILLALEAMSSTHTAESEQALHQAVQSSRVRQLFDSADEFPSVWLTMSPDGKRIYTSGLGGGAMWDVAAGEVDYSTPQEMFGDFIPEDADEFWINRADFSPDGSLLALPVETWIGDEPQLGFVAILDAETGEVFLVFEAHDSGVQDLSFSPDGSLMATGSLAGLTKIWDVAASLAAGVGQELATLCCHEDWVLSANFSPDGLRIVTSSEAIKVWDIATGDELYAIEEYDPNEAIFSPDGQFIVAVNETQILTFEAETGELYHSAPGPGNNFVVLIFSPDGSHFAASNYDGSVMIWNYAEGEIDPDPLILSGHRGPAAGIAYTADGRWLASGGVDGTARLWDVSLNGASEFGTYAHDSRAMDVAISSDGSWLASVSLDGTAKIWDVITREERYTLEGHDGWVIDVDIHPEGHELATAGTDGTVRFWNAETGEQRLVIQAHEVVDGFCSGACGVSFSPDGKHLATGGADLVVRIWDVASGEELFSLTGHTDNITGVDYSPNGRWLISVGEDGMLMVWDPAGGRELWSLPGDGSIIWGATFDEDGSRLVAGHGGGHAVVWSFPTSTDGPDEEPEETLRIQHNPQFVGEPRFSPDGRVLAIPGPDMISLHDAETGEVLVELGHSGTTTFFSSDGRFVATAGDDGRVRLLAVNVADLVELARSRLTRSLTDTDCQEFLHLEACP
jgi:WD40 repeat protein